MTGVKSTSARAGSVGRRKLPLPSGLGQVRLETVQDQVYRELRRALIYGLFDPGQVLGIQDLADQFGTSTMPVRDALGRLVSEQALEAMPNRSVRVPQVDLERLEDLRRARIYIEGLALELAVTRLTAADYAVLDASIVFYERTASADGEIPIDDALEANRAFHFGIYGCAGSTVLIPIIESLWLQSGPLVRAAVLAFDRASVISAPRYHTEMLAAMRASDIAGAKQALALDIGRTFDILRERLA